MLTLYLVLYLVSAVCLLLAVSGVVLVRQVNLVALGLFFWVLVPLIQTVQKL